MKRIIFWIIILSVIITFLVVTKLVGGKVCNKYGDRPGMRANICNSNAPWFCKNTHFPPSQEGYQDSVGCGFIF